MGTRGRESRQSIVALLSSFVAVTIVLCGVLALAHMSADHWRSFTERLVALAYTQSPRGDQTEPTAAAPVFGEGVVFAIGYRDDGSVTGKKGVCPDQSQKAWLEEFKRAVVTCAKPADLPLRLSVRGFASVAPVGTRGTDLSDEGNVAIANRRGRVIARFLADESEKFGSCDPDLKTVCPPSRRTAEGDCLANGGSYIVRYRDWPDYSTMRRFSPANDGGRPAPRYPVEFLNRTVHIVAMNNAC